jgi:hypothetical protein
MDQNNRGVATLQASDFAVVDKDVIVRNFQSFTRTDWTKLQIAILVDGSESVRPRFRQEIADILELMSQTAKPAAKIPSLVSGDAKKASDADLTDMIANGGKDKKASHAFATKGITPDQVKMVVSYIREAQKK